MPTASASTGRPPKVRAIAAEGSKLCASGKTKETMVKYDEAATEAGLAASKK